jgi:ATP-binding cassette subfamily B protein
MQCGIACMAMICKYYGKGYSFETLSHLCTATTEGVSLLSLKKLGENLGLETLYGRISISQISEINSPCILHYMQTFIPSLNKGVTLFNIW